MSRRNKAKRFESIALAIIIAVSFSFGLSSVAFASDYEPEDVQEIIYYAEEWVTPQTFVITTMYNLCDGFVATETITTSYETISRASGTLTQTSTVEIKNGTSVAATITVTGRFAYDGSSATVLSASHSRSVNAGYTETSWGTGSGNSGFLHGAYVTATLGIKQNSTGKSFSETAKVTCSKNGD